VSKCSTTRGVMAVWFKYIYNEEKYVNYISPLCSCVVCHVTKSAKGIFSHYINAHTDDGKKKASERGKKGAKVSKEYSANLRKSNIDAYLNNPLKCKQCDKILPYDIKSNIFCSHSCAATHNNSLRGNKEPKNSENKPRKYLFRKLNYSCLHCGTIKEYSSANSNKYCSHTCQQLHRRKQQIEDGTASSRTLKRYLIDTHGYRCWLCGITEWNGKSIVLELEHVDGNSENNEIGNLSILCPNCHSQTPTYKAKNKGNGRHSRRERYHAGKSF
jgi:hypothetical protein